MWFSGSSTATMVRTGGVDIDRFDSSPASVALLNVSFSTLSKVLTKEK